MRFKSKKTDGYQIFAVAGTHTVSFGIDYHDADTSGLLGFAVERADAKTGKRFYTFGFKVFESVVPNPDASTSVKTSSQPIQGFVWDDFKASDDHEYEYIFHPLKGTPKKLDHSARPISITVHTEPQFSQLEHDVFFNRGVASSQAYAREFHDLPPDKQPTKEAQQAAYAWLGRNLDQALLKFINDCQSGDSLLCAFYEFQYEPAAQALLAAIARNVDVRLIVDAKDNESTDKEGNVTPSAPRTANLALLKKVKFPDAHLFLRQASPNAIAHNKFMVRLTGESARPTEVWTGSTNLTTSGIFGQTNVGHWVRNAEVAAHYRDYWNLLSEDPGPSAHDPHVRAKNKEVRDAVAALVEATSSKIPAGVTPVFSPRAGDDVLELYASLLDGAQWLGCITLAFGVGQVFKKVLDDNDAKSALTFLLLEREDKPAANAKAPFVGLAAKQNVYEAWGSYIEDPLFQWAKETNARALGISKHVSYIHSKFLLRDPLGSDPIVVTGSANFSAASTNDNDENMLLIRGDTRVADIYFTEFNRLFNHYYFRSIVEKTRQLPATQQKNRDEQTLFLAEDDRWVEGYKTGLKKKRLELLIKHMTFPARKTQ